MVCAARVIKPFSLCTPGCGNIPGNSLAPCSMLRLSNLTKSPMGNEKKKRLPPAPGGKIDKKNTGTLYHAPGKYFSQIYHQRAVANIAFFVSI